MDVRIFGLNSDHFDDFSDLLPQDLVENENNRFICAIDDDDVAAGVLAYRLTEGVVELVYINVYDELSEEGVEKALLEKLIYLVDNSEAGYYITSVFPENENYRFLQKALEESNDFMITGSDSLYYLLPENRKNFKYYQRFKDLKGKFDQFCDLGKTTRRKFYKYIREKGIEYTFETDEPELEKNLSICTLDSEGEISACVLFKKKDDEELELSYMMIKPGRERDMVAMLAETLRRLEDKYPTALITIDAVNEKSIKLIDNMFDDSLKKETIFTAIRL